MERLEYLLSIVQFATDTKEKRHIVGGMLVSISLLFGVEWQQKFAWMRGGECVCYEQRVEKYDFLSFVA